MRAVGGGAEGVGGAFHLPKEDKRLMKSVTHSVKRPLEGIKEFADELNICWFCHCGGSTISVGGVGCSGCSGCGGFGVWGVTNPTADQTSFPRMTHSVGLKPASGTWF